jgi:hypothetical protein
VSMLNPDPPMALTDLTACGVRTACGGRAGRARFAGTGRPPPTCEVSRGSRCCEGALRDAQRRYLHPDGIRCRSGACSPAPDTAATIGRAITIAG